MKRRQGLIVALTGLAIVGCKPTTPSSSAVQSLDNFAAGATVRVNQCRGANAVVNGVINRTVTENQPLSKAITFGSDVAAASQPALADAVKTTLTAVPA